MADPDLTEMSSVEIRELGRQKLGLPSSEKETGPSINSFLPELDSESIRALGKARMRGASQDELFGVLREQFGKDRTLLGEPGRGLVRGLGGLGDIGLGLGAVGASIVGAEETVQDIGGRLEGRQFRRGITNAPLQEFEGAFDNPESFVTWLAGVTGEQAPNIATIIAGGGVGTLVGKAIAQKTISRQVANRAIDFAIRHSGEAGVFGTASALETGGIAGEQLEATGTVDPLVTVIAGVVAGSLEGLTPLMFASSFGLVDSILQKRFLQTIANKIDDVRKRPTRALMSAIQTAPLEGVTEFAQEVVAVAARAFVDENFDALSPETRGRLLESAVTGAFIGGVYGGLVGAVAPQIGVSADAPLATFTDSEAGGTVTPGTGAALPIEPIDETVPFVFADESGAIIGREEGETLDFRNRVRGFREFALNRRGNEVTRFFTVENVDSADKSALLEDLPTTIDNLGTAPGVTVKKNSIAAVAKAQDAISQRNFALQSQTAGATVSFKNQMKAARKLYQEALDLGFRMEPREGNGFTLVGKADLREVTYEPRNFVGSPTSQFGFGEPSLREVIVTAPTKKLGAVVPLGEPALIGLADTSLGNLIQAQGKKTFSVDVTRLPQEQLLVGDHLLFKRMVRDIADAQPNANLTEESQLREALQILVDDGTVTVPSDIEFSILLESLINVDTSRAAQRFRQAFERGAEVRPLEVTADNVGRLFFKGSSTSVEFLLAATGVPRFPSYLAQRKDNLNFLGTNKSLGRWLEKNYGVRTKSGKRINLEKLTAKVTVAFASSGIINSAFVDSKEIGGARLMAIPLLRQFMKRFKIEDKVVFVFSNQSDNGGFFFRSLEGVTIISLNIRTLIGPTLTPEQRIRLVDTLSHEFGHALAAQEMGKFSEGEISQLLNAYTRDLFRAEFLEIGDSQQQYGAIPDFLGFKTTRTLGRDLVPGQTLSGAEIVSDGVEFTNYLLSFDEWFAQNMAKWALDSNLEPTTPLEKSLQRIARLLKKYFAAIVGIRAKLFSGVEDFAPDIEFKKFIDRIIEKQSETGKPVSQMLPAQGQQEVKFAKSLNSPYERTAAINPSRSLVDFVIKKTKNITPEQKTKLLETATAADYFNGLMKWGYNILQTGRLNPDNQTLQDYIAQTRQWHIESTQWKARVSENIRKWERLGKVQADALGRFIFEIEQMTFLTEQEHKDGKFRRPTADELNSIAARHGLVEQSKDVYQLIVKDFDDFLKVVETVEQDRIRKEFAGSPNLQSQLDKVTKEFNRLRKRPYFPHARFGQTAVVIKDNNGKTQYMEQVEGPLFSISVKLATRRARELTRKLNASETLQEELQVTDGFKISVVKIPEAAQPFRGLPPTMLKMIEDKLTLTDEQRIWLKELIVDMSPTNSFRKRLGKRENIPGYSRDAMRAYADYFWHGSNFLARLTHGLAMQDTLIAGEKDLSDRVKAGIDTVKRRQILEYLQDHFTNIMNPGPDWAQLRSASFSWWLGFVPASAILNLTQVPMVALPFLSTQFGTVKTLNALRKAYADIVKLNRDPVKALEETGDIDFKHLGLAMKQGFIDESWATEIAATATSGNLTRMKHGSQTARVIGGVGHAAAWMFQASEAKVNRRVVFRAAIELARADPNSAYLQELVRVQKTEFDSLVKDEGFSETEAKAFLAGRDAVDRSQFEYASWARPRFMRGRLGVLFMFFMFVQNSLFFAVHEPGRLRYMLMLMTMAGVMGLPGAEDMAAIAQFIARRLGMRLNVEEEVSRFVVDNFGGDVPPDLLLHGASRFGFGIPAAADMIGIPLPVFDMSASISMGRLIPGVSELGPPGRDFDRRFSKISTDVAGATFGIGINFLKMMNDAELPWTDPKRWERGMPRALKNVIKAGRYGLEGKERTRSGSTFVEFDTDEFEDIGEILLAGAGFQPRKLTREWDRVAAKREAETYWTLRRGILMKQFGIAALAGDKEAAADMIEAIKRYNNDVPFRTMAITRETLRKGRKERLRRRRLEEAGISQTKMFQPLSQDLNRLFPSDKGGVVDVQDVSRIR